MQGLAASQDLLVKSAWRGAGLCELVRSQLAYFEDLIGPRIDLRGPPLFVSSQAAQTIGMALHELATSKYGALSGAAGRIDVAWDLQGQKGKEIFSMSWRKHSACPTRPPAKRGFGSTVIRELAESSLGAKVELEYTVTGLTWQLRCSAHEVLEGSIAHS